MHTRKRIMAERSDAFVVMPGGYGTLDELAEIVVWRQLGLHHKPIIMLNIAGFWDHYQKQLDVMAAEGFIKPEHRNHLIFVKTAEEVMPALMAEFARLEALEKAGPGPAHGNKEELDEDLTRT